ncbi:MAG: ABC transporter substrate-binding protein [Betaproteobacteria bacterium]|nr:ABC transporter substrate-binding protein [Betaproteobacteria bacterium]MDE2047726.1 ABC transporter substrate-binding protein [Betaproteobacteria bacterium]
MTMMKKWMTGLIAAVGLSAAVHAQTPAMESPDALVKRLSVDVIDAVKSDKQIQSGDIQRVTELVDAKILPYTNFQRMTSMAVGRYWRQATPDQQKRLEQEFKALLVRTYAGALTQVKDQSVQIRPLRASPQDTDVIVRTQVLGGGEPIQLDYRLEKTPAGWKVYDLNVLGVWLVETYRASFASEISKGGIDGLIATLTERNKQLAQRKS